MEDGPSQLEELPTTDNPPPATFNFGETNVDNSQAPQSTDPNAANFVEEFNPDTFFNQNERNPRDTREEGYINPVSALGMNPSGDGTTSESVTLQIETARKQALADKQYTDDLIAKEVAVEYPNQANDVEDRQLEMDEFLLEKKRKKVKKTVKQCLLKSLMLIIENIF